MKNKTTHKKITKRSVFAFVLSTLSFFFRALALVSIFLAVKDILKDRKKEGRHFLSVAAIVISGIIFFGLNIITNYHNRLGTFETSDKASLVYTIDEEVFKNTESDIEGYSLYDKMEAGLDVEDESDTDGDGLTDKEEIEKYGTDPLKMSTSGDLIPDAYKVSMGLSLNEKYDVNACSFADYGLKEIYNSPDNVTIDKTDVNNAYASIYEHCRYDGETKAVAGYDFVDVEGDVSVDFSEFIDDDSAYVAYLETLSGERRQLSISDGMVYGTLDGAYGNISVFDKYAMLQNNEALLFVPSGWFGEFWDFYLNGIWGQERHIYIFEKSTKNNNPERGAFLSKKLSERFGKNIVVHHRYLSGVEFEAKKIAYDSVLAQTNVGDKYWTWDSSMSESDNMWSYAIKKVFSAVYVYQHLEDDNWDYSEAAVVQIAYVGEGLQFYQDMVMTGKFWQTGEEKKVVGADFDLIDDTFAFSNFKTINNGGYCAGISKIIASRYNGEYLDRKMGWNCSSRYINVNGLMSHPGYDLTDAKYDAIFDNTISLKTIEKDKNVKNACVVYWARINDDNVSIKDEKNNKASVIEELRDYLQSDRIAIVSLSGKNNAGIPCAHAINVYAIEETNDPNVIYLLVYDNNIVCEKNKTGYRDAFRIRITTVKNHLGEEEFEFYYDASLTGLEFLSGEKDEAPHKGKTVHDCVIRFILAEGGTVENPMKPKH